ncbi:hypothetical protein CXG81DRAFT_19153 [Caulochytrium protostelioides]|uniref:SET domain-containing protein n=1 Tax=Caulochytrium protostelioides TaxID=1555241 RepID=A0A4P9X7S7_9FUNG|nr:hypothetical protein CXG81DRAFT_19153 [Caulochytrium protostelioides]|eukprot:RKP01011.1 hypothetical protein CXG81DRAFT_19153 [Caulochytrium protostelioides]
MPMPTPTPTPPHGERPLTTDHLLAWVRAHGGTWHPALRIGTPPNDPDGGRGVYAVANKTTPLPQPDAVFAHLPDACVLSLRTLTLHHGPTHPAAAFLAATAATASAASDAGVEAEHPASTAGLDLPRYGDLFALAIAMVHAAHDPASHWRPYLDTLPTRYDDPLWWSPRVRAAMARTPAAAQTDVLERLLRRLAAWLAACDDPAIVECTVTPTRPAWASGRPAKRSAPETDAASAPTTARRVDYSYERLRWAFSGIMSRAFPDRPANKASMRISSVKTPASASASAAASMPTVPSAEKETPVTASTPSLEATSLADPCDALDSSTSHTPAAPASAPPAATKRLARVQTDELDVQITQIALFPLLDLLNHNPDARIEWVFDDTGVAFVNREPDLRRPGSAVHPASPAEASTIKDDGLTDEWIPVVNNYGGKGNEMLMCKYGFVMEANPYDYVRVALRCPAPSAADPPARVAVATQRMDLLAWYTGARQPRSCLLFASDPFPTHLLQCARLFAAADWEIAALHTAGPPPHADPSDTSDVPFPRLAWHSELRGYAALDGALAGLVADNQAAALAQTALLARLADAEADAGPDAVARDRDAARMLGIYVAGQARILASARNAVSTIRDETLAFAASKGTASADPWRVAPSKPAADAAPAPEAEPEPGAALGASLVAEVAQYPARAAAVCRVVARARAQARAQRPAAGAAHDVETDVLVVAWTAALHAWAALASPRVQLAGALLAAVPLSMRDEAAQWWQSDAAAAVVARRAPRDCFAPVAELPDGPVAAAAAMPWLLPLGYAVVTQLSVAIPRRLVPSAATTVPLRVRAIHLDDWRAWCRVHVALATDAASGEIERP